MRSVDVAIVGGGILGASCAYFLAEAGATPLLLESGRVGRESSGASAGGVRQQGRQLPEMPLALAAIDLWPELDARLESPVEYERCGDLRLAESPADAERLRALADAEARAGVRTEWLEGAALRALVPGLGPTMLAGVFCPTGGQANPLLVTPAFAARARDLGGVVWEGSPVRALARDGAGFALDTAQGPVRAERLVVAAGAWTPGLAAALGLELPIELYAPQMQVTPPIDRVLGPVLLGFSRRLSMKQARNGTILIGGGKRGWGDLATRARGLLEESIRRSAVDAVAALPGLAQVETTRSWVGLEGLTPDEMPIIAPFDGGAGWVAAGFCGHGFAIGPVVGRVIAETLLGRAPSLDLSAFSSARFRSAV